MIKIFKAATTDELEEKIEEYIKNNNVLLENVKFSKEENMEVATCIFKEDKPLINTGNIMFDNMMNNLIKTIGEEQFFQTLEEVDIIELMKSIGIEASDPDAIRQSVEFLKSFKRKK